MTLTAGAKILGIAFAVGLDVLALSIAVGVMRIDWPARIRLGAAFSASEVLMQLVGYGIGTGAGALPERPCLTWALQSSAASVALSFARASKRRRRRSR